MNYCNICGGAFYVEEQWTGSEWRPVLYNEKATSPQEVNCTECPLFLPFEEDPLAEASGTRREEDP